MKNILERLRDTSQYINSMANESGWTIVDEAAEEIERLTAENERLREAIQGVLGRCSMGVNVELEAFRNLQEIVADE